MEKFSQWRDKSTGLHPFLPPKVTLRAGGSFVYALKVLLLARLVLSAILLPIILLLQFIVKALERVFILRVIVDRVAVAFLLRMLLFIWGFVWINEEWADHDFSITPAFRVAPGHIIYSNHVSYLEFLWLAFRYGPVFTALPLNGFNSDVPTVHVVTLWEGVIQTWNNSQPQSSPLPLSEVVESARNQMRPVVVFPEGTTTNGTILLSLILLLQKVSTQVHVMGFKYGTKDFCPAYSFGVWWFHVFRLCAQLYNEMTVRFLPDQNLPNKDKGEHAWETGIQNSLAALLDQSVCAKLNAKDKQEFLRYWVQSARAKAE